MIDHLVDYITLCSYTSLVTAYIEYNFYLCQDTGMCL